jgi:hypothetical protein
MNGLELRVSLAQFVHRIVGASALDVSSYIEIENDLGATGQAMVVVALAGLAAGVGSGSAPTLGRILNLTLIAILSWVAWAVVTFEVARRLLPEPRMTVNFPRVLRTFGFAASPGLLRVAGFIVPAIAWPAAAIAAVWMLVAMVVALRQALDFRSTARAALVCLIAWLLSVGLALGLQVLLSTRVS